MKDNLDKYQKENLIQNNEIINELSNYFLDKSEYQELLRIWVKENSNEELKYLDSNKFEHSKKGCFYYNDFIFPNDLHKYVDSDNENFLYDRYFKDISKNPNNIINENNINNVFNIKNNLDPNKENINIKNNKIIDNRYNSKIFNNKGQDNIFNNCNTTKDNIIKSNNIKVISPCYNNLYFSSTNQYTNSNSIKDINYSNINDLDINFKFDNNYTFNSLNTNNQYEIYKIQSFSQNNNTLNPIYPKHKANKSKELSIYKNYDNNNNNIENTKELKKSIKFFKLKNNENNISNSKSFEISHGINMATKLNNFTNIILNNSVK